MCTWDCYRTGLDVRLLLLPYCVIVVKYVAFFAICGKWTMAFTFTSLPFNFYSMHELRNQSFQLVSSSVRSKQLLCFVHGQGQKREQKHTTKNFVEFLNHSPLLTMPWVVCYPMSGHVIMHLRILAPKFSNCITCVWMYNFKMDKRTILWRIWSEMGETNHSS